MKTLTLFGGGDLHDVVEQRSVHLLESVRNTLWDDNYVAFSDAADLAATDFFPANLIRRDGFRKEPGADGRRRVSLVDYLLVNCTGSSNDASPRFASAQAHQICTFAMSWT